MTEIDSLFEILKKAKELSLRGIYTHAGQSYSCKNKEEIDKIAKQEISVLTLVAEKASQRELGHLIQSFGSTPVCSKTSQTIVPNGFEFHPGNYIFYDRQQYGISSCSFSAIACRVIASVISHYPSRNAFLLDCGSTSLSKDPNAGSRSKSTGQNVTVDYALFEENEDFVILNLSQEICTVSTRSGDKIDFAKFPLGSKLSLIPNHSCLAAFNFREYYLATSHNRGLIHEVWKKTI